MADKVMCPMCSGKGKINPPSFAQKKMSEKKSTAKKLRKQGYSIREIMVKMKYKSPRSVSLLIE